MPPTLVALAAAVAALAASAGHAATERAACTPGTRTVGGVQERVFCGPAKATVTVGGKTLRFAGGSCERTPAYVSVNIGTVVLGPTGRPKPDYFGLDVGAYPGGNGKPAGHDGTFTGAVLALEYHGKSNLLRGDTA